MIEKCGKNFNKFFFKKELSSLVLKQIYYGHFYRWCSGKNLLPTNLLSFSAIYSSPTLSFRP